MIKRVAIYKGELDVPGFDGEPGLSYKLAPLDDAPFVREFRGDGNREGNQLTIWKGDIRTTVAIGSYLVSDTPTPESLDYYNGYQHGKKQKIMRWPASKPERFVEGWREAWKERGR